MLLVFFFLTKVAGNSDISLQTKSARLHVASCLINCRIASPIFSLVSVQYSSKTIYHDKENAYDTIINYPNYRDYIVTPVYCPPLMVFAKVCSIRPVVLADFALNYLQHVLWLKGCLLSLSNDNVTFLYRERLLKMWVVGEGSGSLSLDFGLPEHVPNDKEGSTLSPGS